jgi:hypothetical protein
MTPVLKVSNVERNRAVNFPPEGAPKELSHRLHWH